MQKLHDEVLKNYKDLVYNAYTMLRDYYTYEDISMFPLRDLFHTIDYFKPKFQEIAQRQQRDAMALELQGKKGQLKPGTNRQHRG